MSMHYTTRNRRNVREMKEIIRDYHQLKELPSLGNFLTLIACHTDRELKLNTIKNNLPYFNFSGNKVVIINSSDCQYNKTLKDYIQITYPDINYVDYPNSSQLDMGKWMSYLKDHLRGQMYNYIVFTNDSFLIQGSINHFYNGATQSMKDLYAFTSSSQIHYHYQSYMFAVQMSSIRKLINYYNRVKHKLTDYMSVVGNIELQLYKLFRPACGAVLNLGTFPGNTGRNVFFNNDSLYSHLREIGVLPMIKLKRIEADKLATPRKTLSSHFTINQGFSLSTSTNSVVSNADMSIMKSKERTPIKRGVLPANLSGLLEDKAIHRY